MFANPLVVRNTRYVLLQPWVYVPPTSYNLPSLDNEHDVMLLSTLLPPITFRTRAIVRGRRVFSFEGAHVETVKHNKRFAPSEPDQRETPPWILEQGWYTEFARVTAILVKSRYFTFYLASSECNVLVLVSFHATILLGYCSSTRWVKLSNEILYETKF